MTAVLATKDIPRTTKSPEAFRTISEVASELDVPQHVLRFWETRFAQVRPVKRAGGRRYYRPEDVDLLRGIRALLYHDGLTIKGVQKVLRDQGLKYVAEIGRGEATLMGSVERERALPVDDAPRYARAAFAVLERALPEAADDAATDVEAAEDIEAEAETVEAESAEALGDDADETVAEASETEFANRAGQDDTVQDSEPAPLAQEPGLFDDQHHVNAQAEARAANAAAPLDAAERTKLELRLSDLLTLKANLRAARERVAS